MPRDSFGAYSLPTGTLVNTGQTIQVAQHNPAMSDISAALSDSLSRSGYGAMQALLNMGGYVVANMGAATSADHAPRFDQVVKKAGDTGIGPLALAPGNGVTIAPNISYGGASLVAGDATHTGYVAFYRPNGARIGYIGFAYTGGTTVNYANDTAAGHSFTGGQLFRDGHVVWDAGNSFGANLGNPGYQRMPSGLIIQWGNGAHSDGSGAEHINFPIAFPNGVLSSVASNDAGGPPTAFHGTGGTSTTGMTVYSASSAGVATGAGTAFRWIAIGF